MKALDEVIKCLDGCGKIDCDDCPYHYEDEKIEIDNCEQVYKDALQYLKMYKELADDSEAFAEWKENPPLTWTELQQMEGKPVWIEEKDMPSTWIIIWDVTENWLYPTGCDAYRHDEYGNSWQAYRKERE